MGHGSVVVADFGSHDERAAENTVAENPIAMPDDAWMVMDRVHYCDLYRCPYDPNQLLQFVHCVRYVYCMLDYHLTIQCHCDSSVAPVTINETKKNVDIALVRQWNEIDCINLNRNAHKSMVTT